MKARLLILVTTLSLTACTSVPKPVLTVECPKVPMLLWDAPERDWQGQMQNFLQGTLPTQQDFNQPTTPADKPTK